MASKVNTGNRTPAQDAEATAALIKGVTASGAKVTKDKGEVYATTTAFGLTVKTRIG